MTHLVTTRRFSVLGGVLAGHGGAVPDRRWRPGGDQRRAARPARYRRADALRRRRLLAPRPACAAVVRFPQRPAWPGRLARPRGRAGRRRLLPDRNMVVQGQRVPALVYLGGRRILKKKK